MNYELPQKGAQPPNFRPMSTEAKLNNGQPRDGDSWWSRQQWQQLPSNDDWLLRANVETQSPANDDLGLQ